MEGGWRWRWRVEMEVEGGDGEKQEGRKREWEGRTVGSWWRVSKVSGREWRWREKYVCNHQWSETHSPLASMVLMHF